MVIAESFAERGWIARLVVIADVAAALWGCATATPGKTADVVASDTPPAQDATAADLDTAPPADAGSPPDAGPPEDADISADAGSPWPYAGFAAVGAGEYDLAFGWIGAGQPDEARLTEVVAVGARVISLRLEAEDPFAEQELVEGLGGVFIRYPTQGSYYQEVAFREGMYDLYDAQIEQGGPVYLHCASSNRVGAAWALYHAERLGLPAEEALELGKAAGLSSLEPMVKELLGLD